MKKMMILGFLILFLTQILSSRCATIPPGPPKPGVPRISNLTVPKTVNIGRKFPVSFQFEDSEIDIKAVILTYEWSFGGPIGSESHSYGVGIYGKTNGICEVHGFAGKLPNVFDLSVYVEDAKGNKSNILRTSIATK
jgi:hypothetical protein